MALTILRNDITKMRTDAIVNTANEWPVVGAGCDSAVYQAAGYSDLLAYRKEKVGRVPEGEAFITPGFALEAKYIIHAVSPRYVQGDGAEEQKLRACYQNSLKLAEENGIRSIAFPLIATGSYGYPKEEGLRIAVDEINAFLLQSDMQICLVVFDETAAKLGQRIAPGLAAYIDRHYVEKKQEEEYEPVAEERPLYASIPRITADRAASAPSAPAQPRRQDKLKSKGSIFKKHSKTAPAKPSAPLEMPVFEAASLDFEEAHLDRLNERMRHLSDTFSEYLFYLIEEKHMTGVDVYKRAIVDKKIFSKIKNNPQYHPQKLTALCLCVGARLNMDETQDLLARAGYALSPADKTDVIFAYFIENEIYDMIELDIQLEEHGLPCIIT